MARTITAVKTTAGETFRKKEDSIGRTYYVQDGKGRTSRQAFAAAHTNVSVIEVTDDIAETVDRIAEAATDEPDYVGSDLSDSIDEDDPRAYLSEVFAWTRDEPGIPIQDYPADERAAELREIVEANEAGFDKFAYGLRYRVIAEDGHVMPGSRLTTRYLSPQEDGYFALEADFMGIVDQLLQVAADYDAVIVDATVAEGFKQ